jgi:uncharacterized protein (DUF362 family)
MTEVFVLETTRGVQAAMDDMLDRLAGAGAPLPKDKGGHVYVKVNGIDFKEHCYTSPEVLKALLRGLNERGAGKVHVMENSTQGNLTRVVFDVVGYGKICKKNGAKPVYLDEEPTKEFTFQGKPASDKFPGDGYSLKTFHLPRTIASIIENRDSVLYINLPKLKTHSMAGVTLGIKNQWGFPRHADRGKDHNYNLHSKIVDVYGLVKPDYTIIDGITGTIHGHYPPAAFADRLVKRFNVLVGGRDTVAVDTVGARIFGLQANDVPHIRIAGERHLGETNLDAITVVGKSLDTFTEKYGTDLLQEFPEDVLIVKGKDLLCKEGCQNNPLSVLQFLTYDHGGKGGFFIVMGKGFDADLTGLLKGKGFTRGLVVGRCAVEEVGKPLQQAFGKGSVFLSDSCNGLANTTGALLKLMGLKVWDLFPKRYPIIKAVWNLIMAKLHGSKALVVPIA